MRRIATLAVAVALLGGAGAATASAEQAGTQGCTTWQYRIERMTAVIEPDGAGVVLWAYQGNKFNTKNPNGVNYYYGNLYQDDGTFRATGLVDKDDLDWTGNCW